MHNVWPWVEDVMVPEVYYTHDYAGNAVSKYDQKFISNMYAQRLGPVKLRQIRVIPGNIFSMYSIFIIYVLECKTKYWSIGRTEKMQRVPHFI